VLLLNASHDHQWRPSGQYLPPSALRDALSFISAEVTIAALVTRHQMTYLDFKVGAAYTRLEIIDISGAPPQDRGGAWFTGYREFGGASFIFANVGTSGRTGHDYNNRLVGDNLIWQGRTGSKLSHSSIRRMLSIDSIVYIFTRRSDRAPFIFKGLGRAIETVDSMPVQVVWNLLDPCSTRYMSEEVMIQGGFTEGAVTKVYVNSYERNDLARRICLEHHGIRCKVCGLDFEEVYGDTGAGFIHVHHLVPLSQVGPGYQVDPVADLQPVCPNCHAMLHRTSPPLEISVLRARLEERRCRTLGC
jgi:5-methylcytosine-specific restriction enzyme A